jgi:hypothetical protein
MVNSVIKVTNPLKKSGGGDVVRIAIRKCYDQFVHGVVVFSD